MICSTVLGGAFGLHFVMFGLRCIGPVCFSVVGAGLCVTSNTLCAGFDLGECSGL